MAQNSTELKRIVPSLLDRLLDESPDVSQEVISKRFQDTAELRRSIARDLESLLNTRREALFELPAEFEAVNHSLLVYGLPDVTTLNLMSQADLTRLRRAIEGAIANFEPRLQRVKLQIEQPKPNDRAVRFRIEAVLHVNPVVEPVVFDTFLQLGTQEYVVKV